VNCIWQTKWTDVSFLNRSVSDVKGQETYGIYRAHISLVISGPSDWRWVAYCFDSHGFDDEDSDAEDSEDDESEDGDSEDNGLQDGDCPFLEDPMAQVDANQPIYDPREYFLLVFQSRITRIVEEWKFLVRWTERHISAYVCSFSFVSFCEYLQSKQLLTSPSARSRFFYFIPGNGKHRISAKRREGELRLDSES